MSPLVDADGDAQPARTIDVKRIFLDWTGIIAIVGGAIVWGTTTSHVESNTREIERLRVANEARAVSDVRIASEMATKSDVREVRDQLTALSVELRARAGR